MKRIAFLIILVSCGSIAHGAWGVPAGPQRIVSLAPAITEIIFALGAQDRLVGVSSYCDFPPEARQIESVGGFINPNLEKIISLKPDLVVVSPNSGTKAVQANLNRLGIPNLIVQFYTIEGLVNAYRQLGSVLGKTDAAVQLQTELAATLDAITARLAGVTMLPRVLFVRAHNPLYVAAPGTYEDDLIIRTGGINCIPHSSVRYPHYNVEEIVRLNPDIIIDATFYDTPNESERAMVRSVWAPLTTIHAVQNNRIYIIKTDIHSVPGPRTPQMLTILASLVHPEYFGPETEFSETIVMGNEAVR